MSNQTVIEPPARDEVAIQTPPVAPSRWSDPQILLGLLAISLASHAPLLYLHITHLLNRSYYEFIYVLPIALWLMYRHYGGVSQKPSVRPHRVKSIAAIVVALGLYGCSILLWSPWLSAVSVLATFAALVYSLWGRERLKVLVPALLLGCLIIPPPLRYDGAMTGSLRSLATSCSSRVLDSVGVLHLAEGNVITVASGSLFVADACSGVNSLYSLLAVALFYCLWTRRHWFHTLLLLGLVTPVVLLENTFRIALIPLALEWFDVNLSEGWMHTMLGIVLFALSALLIASFDQLLQFFSPLGSALASGLAWFARGRRRANYSDYTNYAPNATAVNTGVPARNAPLALPVGAGKIAWTTLVTAAVVFLMAGGVVQSYLFARSWAARPQVQDIDFSKVTAASLPKHWNGWEQVNFESKKRTSDDPFGEHSLIWTYRRNDQAATFSMDFSFPGIHDLSKCYSAIGWDLGDRRVVEDHTKTPYMEIAMQRKNFGSAMLFFSLHSKQGHTEAHAFGESLVDHFNKRFGYRFEDAGPWYQLQLFGPLVKSASEKKQSDDLSAMFAEFRQVLLGNVRQAAPAQ